MEDNRAQKRKKISVLEKRNAAIQGIQDPAWTGQHVGEGTREVSWIWRSTAALTVAASDESCHEGMSF